MSAAAQTWTFPAGQKYVDKDGIEHTIKTGETLTLKFNDTGVGGDFQGREGDTDKVTCTDGFVFDVECDPRFIFSSSVDGSASFDNGELCTVEQDGTRLRWKVKSLTMANADGVGATNVTQMILEQNRNPMRVITWANIDTA